MMDFSEFAEVLKALLPEVTPDMLDAYSRMSALYEDWNSKINVISRKDMDAFYDRHVLHSLAIAGYLRSCRKDIYDNWLRPDTEVTVLDLGTGGGFPGIPLAILFPSIRFTLCDSIGKKIKVAESVSRSLGISNVQTVNARAESLTRTFDFVVSRAVTSLDNFYPWVRGRYTRDIFYLKGGDFAEELCRMMKVAHLPSGSVRTWDIRQWYDADVFQDKFVVDIPSLGRIS